MRPLAVRLGGQAHLSSTISLVIAKLHEDAGLLKEECAEALTLIGTPTALNEVTQIILIMLPIVYYLENAADAELPGGCARYDFQRP